MHDPQRVLHFPGLLNARDLGGYPTIDGARTRWRSLLRSDDLAQLSAAGIAAFSRYGIETVIDLRWADEAAQMPTPVPHALTHVRYEQIPLLTPSAAQWRALRGAKTAKELWNRAMLEHVRAEIRQVLELIATASAGPLLFHCVSGKDRTGVIAALLLALADVAPEAIAYDYAESTANLQGPYLERYAHADPAAIVEICHCPEAGVHNMLAYLAQFGGVRAYLELIGVQPQHIARLRARLRE